MVDLPGAIVVGLPGASSWWTPLYCRYPIVCRGHGATAEILPTTGRGRAHTPALRRPLLGDRQARGGPDCNVPMCVFGASRTPDEKEIVLSSKDAVSSPHIQEHDHRVPRSRTPLVELLEPRTRREHEVESFEVYERHSLAISGVRWPATSPSPRDSLEAREREL